MEQSETIKEAVRKAAEQIRRWHGKGINEAATRAAIIDPLLTGLGWDVRNLELVLPEPVSYGKTRGDYGLLSGDRPVIYVEAKPLDRALDHATDGKQAVDNANSDGVEWCVLTNGKDWWFYKSNAPGNVEGKMFHSATVSPDADMEQVVPRLALLERASVERGSLKEAAEVFFVDRRVKVALDEMMTQPSNKFLNALRDRLGRELTPTRLKASLARIAGVTPPPPPAPDDLERYVADKPEPLRQTFLQLYEAIPREIPGLHPQHRKWAVSYTDKPHLKMPRVAAGIEFRRDAVRVWTGVPYEDAPAPPPGARLSKGWHDTADVRLSDPQQVPYAISLVRLAYEKMKAKG